MERSRIMKKVNGCSGWSLADARRVPVLRSQLSTSGSSSTRS